MRLTPPWLGPVFFLALAPWAACNCDEGPLGNLPDGGRGRCVEDTDCGAREKCNASIGICYPADACAPDRPCPDPAQLCEDRDGDGFNECVFQRCTDDSECATLVCTGGQVPTCSAGGCICGEPCQGGCPPGRGCCVPEDRCYDLPPECMGLTCPRGQFVSVTSSGAWDTGTCVIEGESCRCEVLPPLPIGDIGLYSALAHDGARAVLSGYNLDYGDLMFGAVTGTSTLVSWEFVDGVPTGTVSITGDVNGPRGGNSTPGDDVGVYTDIATDLRGRSHIAYHDRTHAALKYAVSTSTGWRVHTISTEPESGLYASIALDDAERPMIAYLTARADAGAGARKSVLRIALSSTTSPASDADWDIRDLESASLAGFGCFEQCRVGEVCRTIDQRCYAPDPASACTPACTGDQRCIAGTCDLITPLPPFRDVPMARGLWPALAVQSDGTALVAYYDRIDGSSKLARLAGPDPRNGALTVRVVDRVAGSDLGQYPSIFVTRDDAIHLAYLNASDRSLIYRQLNAAGTATQVTETIEAGLDLGNDPEGNLLGADPALVVDASGAVRVAYQDGTLGDLRYALRTGAGQWTITTLRGAEMPYAGTFGFYTDQILAPGDTSAIVSTYRYFLSAMNGPANGVVVVPVP
ncbi:MAG: hypothetical protein IT384_09750 [Deltaproteobacteria bacterium]|nr:hypothetical protein [Deltaproteobacteria bacterium]